MDKSITAAGEDNPQVQEGLPECIEILTGRAPEFSVIWLHGLGADGHDFEPVVPHLGLTDSPAVRFVFPHAPIRPVTLNGGMPMRAWFDIRGMSMNRDLDEAGIRQSTELTRALIEREGERGVPPARVVLAGFSQGGAMALHVGLRYPEPLAGIIALSAYLLFADRLEAERSAANSAMPVFIAHGKEDPVIPFHMGQATAEALRAAGHPLTWRSYPVAHSVAMEEIADIGAWLRELVAGVGKQNPVR